MNLRYPARLNFLFIVAILSSLAVPNHALAHDDCNAIIWTDTPTENQTIAGVVRFGGWALDTKEASFSSGIESVQLFIDGEAGSGGRLIGQATLGNKDATTTRPDLVRPDVDIAFNRSNNRAGWVLDADMSRFTVGRHTVYVYAETHCGWVFSRFSINIDPAAPIVAQPTTASGTPYYTTGTGSLLVRIDNPSAGSDVSGSARISGVAANCGQGSAAPARVRIYEGTDASGTYLGDATLSGRDLAAVCTGRSGMADVAFSFNLNTRRLGDGTTTVAAVADWGSGVMAAGTTTLYVRNYDRGSGYSTYGGYVNPVAYGNCVQYDYRGVCISYSGAYGYGSGLGYGYGAGYCPPGYVNAGYGSLYGSGTVFSGGLTYVNGQLVNNPYAYYGTSGLYGWPYGSTYAGSPYGSTYAGWPYGSSIYAGWPYNVGYAGYYGTGYYGAGGCQQYINGVCVGYGSSLYSGYYGAGTSPYYGGYYGGGLNCVPITGIGTIVSTPYAPGAVVAAASSPTNVNVSWTAPALPAGLTYVISGYQVEIAPTATPNTIIGATVTAAGATTAAVTVAPALVTGTSYTVRVRTMFSNGSQSQPTTTTFTAP